jgi:hypothetical protein
MFPHTRTYDNCIQMCYLSAIKLTHDGTCIYRDPTLFFHFMRCYVTSAVTVTSIKSVTIKSAPGKNPPVPTGQMAGWVPLLVWKLCRREKYLVPAGNRNPAVQPAATLTELSQLPVRNQ